ncbi:MAG: hypothetical protein EOO20_26790 [Chryseobacterium sp.]|nr:MAG: hypothetical protein EOO20_26790 [Chryseobacterium sp.]
MHLRFILLITLIFCAGLAVQAQNIFFEKPRLTSAEGLPQSFISGLVQDEAGFIWVATREGLARYDGIRFKVFRHKVGDSKTLASNIIVSLFQDRQNQLWIQYENGHIDVLNARTEHLYHFSQDPKFSSIFNRIKNVHAIVSPKANLYWMLSHEGGIFIIHLAEKKINKHKRTKNFAQSKIL